MNHILNEPGPIALVILALFVITIVAIRTAGAAYRTSVRERTRREIAAYIAEGSMTPEQGERLMKASEPRASE